MWNTQIHFQIIYNNSVPTSQEKHYVSATKTKPNRLMLFRKTVAVYCENQREHTNTLCGNTAEFLMLKHVVPWTTLQYLFFLGGGGGEI
jgi:hypothetical protein